MKRHLWNELISSGYWLEFHWRWSFLLFCAGNSSKNDCCEFATKPRTCVNNPEASSRTEVREQWTWVYYDMYLHCMRLMKDTGEFDQVLQHFPKIIQSCRWPNDNLFTLKRQSVFVNPVGIVRGFDVLGADVPFRVELIEQFEHIFKVQLSISGGFIAAWRLAHLDVANERM